MYFLDNILLKIVHKCINSLGLPAKINDSTHVLGLVSASVVNFNSKDSSVLFCQYFDLDLDLRHGHQLVTLPCHTRSHDALSGGLIFCQLVFLPLPGILEVDG